MPERAWDEMIKSILLFIATLVSAVFIAVVIIKIITVLVSNKE